MEGTSLWKQLCRLVVVTDLRGSDGTGHVVVRRFDTASEGGALAVVASCLRHLASGGIVACLWGGGL